MYYLKIDWMTGGYDLVTFDCESDLVEAREYIKRAEEETDIETILDTVCSAFNGKLVTDMVAELD